MVVKMPGLFGHYNCFTREYDTPSTTNDEGDHCEKWDGGCENNNTIFAEYSREGCKADGANPSDAVLGIWACNVPVREHQVSAARACNVPFREHQASAVLSCNVPVQEHQGSAVGPVMSPFGTPSLGRFVL